MMMQVFSVLGLVLMFALLWMPNEKSGPVPANT